MGIVYHGSPIENLKVIYPHSSTHGKNYVYATKCKEMALLYMQHWNDFIINVSLQNEGKLEITERYQGAIDDIYKEKSGFLYELSSVNFKENRTGFSGEVVSENVERVIRFTYIENALAEIKKLNKMGNLLIRYYPDKPDYIPDDDSDLIQEAIQIYSRGEKEVIEYCIGLHPHLIESLKKYLS